MKQNFSGGVIVLAAGLGKRMRSTLPKVLHEVAGQPLIFHILDRVIEVAPNAEIGIVVGHGREQVEAAIHSNAHYRSAKISFIHQTEQLGTGHAARCAMENKWGDALVRRKAPVVVLPGDLPLIPKELVEQMMEPLGSISLRLLACELPDPTGYGRVVRRGKAGGVLRIVEEKDANHREKAIKEVVASIYSYQSAFLLASLKKLKNRNAQGEFYLPDLVAMAAGARKRTDILIWRSAQDVIGINDPWELALANRVMQERLCKHWSQTRGVKFVDPWSVQLDAHIELGEGAQIGPRVSILGRSKVGAQVQIGSGAVLRKSTVGAKANIKEGSILIDSEVGEEAQIGPYAHLRPESHVGARAKIGNFVELKKAKIGADTSVAHLSYLGDATVGERVNIGCGFVTCNFDGRVIDGSRKHVTTIGNDAFIGSDCQAVAPIKIGRGAFIASGSTVTEDVPDDALAIARSKQVTKPGYAKKLRPSSEGNKN